MLCDAFSVSQSNCSLYTIESTMDASNLTVLDHCPNTTPFACLAGHYCCANKVLPGEEYNPTSAADFALCPQPPCQHSKSIIADNIGRCPVSHRFSVGEGRLCCRGLLLSETCNASFARTEECCEDGMVTPCPELGCTDFLGNSLILNRLKKRVHFLPRYILVY